MMENAFLKTYSKFQNLRQIMSLDSPTTLIGINLKTQLFLSGFGLLSTLKQCF